MNQPDLGLKVSELRQQKGLTQEQLAELCEVSPRTIQRIESGEVDPRAYTLQCLGNALEFDFGEENTSNENLWLSILHLSSILSIPVLPLLLWSWKKNQSYKIDQAGTPGAQLPDHHDAFPLCRRLPAPIVPRRAYPGGPGNRACMGKYSDLHFLDHMPAIALDNHRDLLHIPGRGQCHAVTLRQADSLCIEHPVRKVSRSGILDPLVRDARLGCPDEPSSIQQRNADIMQWMMR